MEMHMQATNIDQVLEILDSIIDEAKAEESRLGFFAALYRQVTLEVQRGIERGFFDDGPRMERFDTLFANRYFAALDAWQAGAAPTRSWKVAFAAMEQPQEIILQDLLVGMNAHINLDLGIAAGEICPGDEIQDLQGDFDKINQILAALIQGVEAVISRFSPLLGLLQKIAGQDPPKRSTSASPPPARTPGPTRSSSPTRGRRSARSPSKRSTARSPSSAASSPIPPGWWARPSS
jgi:hypothetical protein